MLCIKVGILVEVCVLVVVVVTNKKTWSFVTLSKMTTNVQCDRKMVQCDMNVWNAASKLTRMFEMTYPK